MDHSGTLMHMPGVSRKELANNANRASVVTRDNQQVNFNEGSESIRQSTSVGEGRKHNNIPPSYGAYVWKRIS